MKQEKIDCPACHTKQKILLMITKSGNNIYKPCPLCECFGFVYWSDIKIINKIKDVYSDHRSILRPFFS